jgi:hypothetical protein
MAWVEGAQICMLDGACVVVDLHCSRSPVRAHDVA